MYEAIEDIDDGDSCRKSKSITTKLTPSRLGASIMAYYKRLRAWISAHTSAGHVEGIFNRPLRSTLLHWLVEGLIHVMISRNEENKLSLLVSACRPKVCQNTPTMSGHTAVQTLRRYGQQAAGNTFLSVWSALLALSPPDCLCSLLLFFDKIKKVSQFGVCAYRISLLFRVRCLKLNNTHEEKPGHSTVFLEDWQEIFSLDSWNIQLIQSYICCFTSGYRVSREEHF